LKIDHCSERNTVSGHNRDKQQRKSKQTNKQTYTQGNNENNEGKQHRKNTNGNHAECDHVNKKGIKKQRSIILQANEYEISYT
jgi:hypothetical protein